MTPTRNRALQPGIEIRPAAHEDVRRLREYFVSLPPRDRWLRFAGDWRPTSHDLEQRLDITLVAVHVERREVVGELMFGWESWPVGYEDVAISVAPAYRMQGLASALLRARLAGTGSRFFVAEQVRRENHVARTVLQRLGFTESPSDPDEPFSRFVLDTAKFCTIHWTDSSVFDIDFGDAGRHWYAKVRPDGGALLVNVFAVSAPPAQVIEADVIGRLVGWWHVSRGADPEAVALRLARLVAALPRSV